MNDKNLKKLDFHKILKIHDIFFMKSAIFCLFLLYNVQRESLSLSVCLFVSDRLTSKRLNWMGPHYLWDLTWTQGRFMDGKNEKMRLKTIQIFQNPRKQIDKKVTIKDLHEAPCIPVFIIPVRFVYFTFLRFKGWFTLIAIRFRLSCKH